MTTPLMSSRFISVNLKRISYIRFDVLFIFVFLILCSDYVSAQTTEKQAVQSVVTSKKTLKSNNSEFQQSGQEEAPEIQTIWLTRKSNDPDKIVVNWLTEESGPSIVHFGKTPECLEKTASSENVTLHQVEISVPWRDSRCYYKVQTGRAFSSIASFQTFPTKVLKVAVIGDWHWKEDLAVARLDQPHILMTAGDNITDTWQLGGQGNLADTKSYARLVNGNRDLFRSTPFMPILGNHDHEIRPRGKKFPKISSYDINGTVFCRFFPLPDQGWKWRFDVPDFYTSFITLDLSHTYDFGTTWQPCHPFDKESEQFRWYQKTLADTNKDDFVVTIYNEQNSAVRKMCSGIWQNEFKKGSTICLTGFGGYYERAEADGVVFYNTSIFGHGRVFPDPLQKKLVQEDHYILLTFDSAKKTMTVEGKDFQGKTFDRQVFTRP